MSDKKMSIGGLWKNKSKKGTKYYSGNILGKKVVAFINDNKLKDSQPDIRIYESEEMKKSESQAPEQSSLTIDDDEWG